MKIELNVTKEYDVNILLAEPCPRYWEDSKVDGVEDTVDGTLIPCKDGDVWRLRIDVSTGQILNWKQGVTADVHYKVCDNGRYAILDHQDNEITSIDGYVPTCLCPKESGYGDYIIMDIDKDGFIQGWDNSSIHDDFQNEED